MKIYCILTICIFTLIVCRNVLPDNVFDSNFYSVDIKTSNANDTKKDSINNVKNISLVHLIMATTIYQCH